MPFAISVENITKSFEESRIIDDVSFKLAPGTSTVIVGPAASGKSLLLKCILGLTSIDSGNISINGLTGRNRLKEMNNVGVMFQENALFDSLTVWENIAFRLISQKRISEETAKSIAREKLSQVHLKNDSFYKYPAELSGGMQKRVSLARALVTDPQILLIDEPTAGLDPILTTVICNLIEAHKSKFGSTILAVTSDMGVAREKYDQMLYIENGTIQWSGSLESLQQTGTEPVKEFILE
ncbi:MAG: ABC transporter ATP-binding protein [Rhodospirillaceae bacterium]|nr:ABC transporter ATP-binding protein [Rhodospirillaceae bacterium]